MVEQELEVLRNRLRQSLNESGESRTIQPKDSTRHKRTDEEIIKRNKMITEGVGIAVLIVSGVIACIVAANAKLGGFWNVICTSIPFLSFILYALFIKIFLVPVDKNE